MGPPSGPIVLAAAPIAPEPESGGVWMTLLPVLGSLGIVAFAFVVRSVIYLVVATLMVVAMVGGTLGMRLVQRRRETERRHHLRRQYLAHAAEAEARAKAAALMQRDGLVGLYPDTPGVLTAARDHGALWERRPAHADFGHVRLGLGPVPAAAPVQIGTESGPLATPEPELVRVAHRLVTATRVVPETPVVLPLRSLSSIAVVGDPPAARALVGSWVASLAAFHAPTDLRIVGRVPRYAARAWEWVKWLPHTRDPLAGEGFGRAERAVTTDVVRFAELVEVVAAPRLGQARRAAEPGARAPAGTGSGKVAEHVVVLVDAYEPDADVAAVKHLDILLERGADLAVTVIALVDDPAKVPSICGARVELAPDGTATYREAGPDGRVELRVSADRMDRVAAEQLARWLAPLRLTGTDAGADLIDTVRLVDLLGLEHAGQVTPWQWPTVRDLAPGPSEVSRSWEAAPARDPAELLRTPIGIGTDGSPLVLDLKDLAAGGMGPHGILVGATGSGKSELLRSLVTGLAARHDPRLVNFVLVDFKGGAAFAELADLPHTVGLITNLADEPTLVDRMQAALRGELVRRQQLLRDAGNLDSIRDYHAAQAASGLPTDLPDLPYLLVIVDEFGELLAAKPEFIDTVVAIGRLGRSMGIHLLLATQRLDEGRIRGLESHLRYRLCLRTFSASESQAVLGSAAAHELPPLPGLGWLRVDTALTRFKGAICSLPYRPPSRTDPNPATVQPFALDLAAPRQDLEVTVAEPGAGRASELQVIIDTLATARVPPPHQVWRPPLPDVLALDQLEVPRGGLRPVVGLLDEPDRQRQGPLVLELDGAGGHVALVGGPRTGKSTFLRTLVHALTGDRSPDEVQVYAVDLGGGSLFDLADLPHVGAVCGRHEPDAIARLLREVRAVVDERATAFRVTGVTTLTGLRASQRRAELLPDPLAAETFLLIDNVGLLRTEFTDLELGLPELAATSLQFGVHLVLTAGRWLDIRPALLDTIGTRLELRLNDPVDSQFGRAAATTLPEDRPGRGLIRARRQFQLALPWRPGDVAVIDGRAAVDHAASQARARWPGRRAPQVRPLPLQVTEADVPDLAAAAGRRVPPASGFLLGVEEFRLAPVHLDLLAPGAHLLIYGDDQSGRSTMLRRAIDHLAGSNPDLVRLHIVDLRRALGADAGAPHVDHYAFAGSLIQETADDLLKLLLDRLPGADLRRTVLLEGSWWAGPEHVLVVDDYDLTLTGVDGPLGTLANALGHARDLGFHVLLSRRVAGAQRTGFEPFGQRLRELGPPTLLLNGDKGEGPLAGDRTAGPQPPGRGLLVRRGRRDALVQCCLPTRRPPRGAER